MGRLRYESKHTFLSCGQILQDVNHLLALYPEWKRAAFTERHLEVDRESLLGAITFRREGSRDYVYLTAVHQAERCIEDRVRRLATYSDIPLKSPVTEKCWRDLLFEAVSPLATKAREAYEGAIQAQAAVCAKIFVRPLSVVWGAAGTGKTTIIRAILHAIEKTQGTDATFLWSAVQRIIIVGDPNQLPPIGRGKVFADIIDWLRANYPASLGELMVNLRQMENQVDGRGTGILDLASLYLRSKKVEHKDEEESLRAEEMFQRLQD